MPTNSILSLILSAYTAVFFFTSAALSTEIEISDPHKTLDSLSFMGSQVEFSKAFVCNQPVFLFTKTGQCKIHCEFHFCEQLCNQDQIVETKFQAEECSSEQVMIYSSLGHIITATSNDYLASSNSLALTVLKAMTIFYEPIEKIQIDSVVFGIRKGLVENGQLKPIQLTTLNFSIFPDRTKLDSILLQLHLDLDKAGLNQIMCLSENGACNPNQKYLIKRKGLVNATF